jgi:hypothetical protein
MVMEIVEKGNIEELKMVENRNPKISRQETNLLDNKSTIKDLVKSAMIDEILKRVNEGDSNAFSILVAAKEKVKHELPIYTNTLKLTLLALKPYYLIALISILTQKPESV